MRRKTLSTQNNVKFNTLILKWLRKFRERFSGWPSRWRRGRGTRQTWWFSHDDFVSNKKRRLISWLLKYIRDILMTWSRIKLLGIRCDRGHFFFRHWNRLMPFHVLRVDKKANMTLVTFRLNEIERTSARWSFKFKDSKRPKWLLKII